MGESEIFLTPDDDPEMEAASKLARRTFRFFWREVSWERRRIIPANYLLAIKGAFSDPPEKKSADPNALEVEHMWVSDVNFDGEQLSGTLLNDPGSLLSMKAGDAVKLRPSQLSDWMYARDAVYGAFTVQLMRARMSAGERKQHDNAWGLDFGSPEIVHVVPPEYVGEAPVTKKRFFGLLGKASNKVPQDYNAAALVEHPMSQAMASGFQEQLEKNPSMLTEADEDGFTYLHSLALGGSYDCVKVLLDGGADVDRVTANGKSAYALAKSLGWTKVMKLLESAGAKK